VVHQPQVETVVEKRVVIPPQEEIMAEIREMTLEQLTTPNVNWCGSSITPLDVAENNFETKVALTQQVRVEKFGGLEEEDPNQHIHNFLANLWNYKDEWVSG
jgi:hypothetical protein